MLLSRFRTFVFSFSGNNCIVARSRSMSSSLETPAKRAARMKIGTHNGKFHCDEVLACYMLQRLPEYRDAEIVRSRDPAVLEECDIVVDVGGVFDPARHRYDHHQKSFSHSMNSLNSKFPFVTKLSSAGLVYFHFGRRVLAQLLNVAEDHASVDSLFLKVYQNFMEEVDAGDNGISAVDGVPRFHVTTTLGSRVGYLNPEWNDPSPNETECFFKAYNLVGTEFVDRVTYFHTQWMPARDIVLEAIKSRHEVHESGEIIRIGKSCPWKQHLYEIEEEMSMEPNIKFALFADQKGQWRVQTVSMHANSFENRVPIKAEWAALRDAELSELSGIAGCVFVHANLFIGGNATYEGAREMAVQSLAAQT